MSKTSEGDPAEGRPASVQFQTPAPNARRRPRSGSLPTPPELRQAAHTRNEQGSPSNREFGCPLAPSPFEEGHAPAEPYVYHRRSAREQILEEQLEALQIRNDELERTVHERPAPRPFNFNGDFGDGELRPGRSQRAAFSTRTRDHRDTSPAPQVTTNSRYKVKASDVPKFKAQVGEDVDLWIAQVSAIYSQAGCSDDDLLQSLPSLFKGKAAKWFATLTKEERDSMPTWHDWKNTLRRAH
jgi:hypothetical protein